GGIDRARGGAAAGGALAVDVYAVGVASAFHRAARAARASHRLYPLCPAVGAGGRTAELATSALVACGAAAGCSRVAVLRRQDFPAADPGPDGAAGTDRSRLDRSQRRPADAKSAVQAARVGRA